MINIVAIASLRDLPQMASYGIGSIFFYVLAALAFFVPVSLVSAELATTWPERGGVYVWVREAFGTQWGFVAVFLAVGLSIGLFVPFAIARLRRAR